MAALRGVLAVVTELLQLLVEGLDGGFLLAQNFLYQVVAVGFERLLLGEEFIDRIIWHDAIMPEKLWRRGAPNETALLPSLYSFIAFQNLHFSLNGKEG